MPGTPARSSTPADDDQAPDFVPTAALDDPAAELTDAEIQRLTRFLKRAEDLKGPKPDAKLKRAADIVDQMLRDGHRPIVFCRFIDTATYVAENLQKMLAKKHKGLQVRSVTGSDGDSDQRKEIVRQLAEEPVRVLVATDCLSEGINLQEWFDAVLHYDLPWNPNRLEQREGRVDRYGQEKDTVQMALLYGANNQDRPGRVTYLNSEGAKNPAAAWHLRTGAGRIRAGGASGG